MDEFNPQGYRPEDEYAPFEAPSSEQAEDKKAPASKEPMIAEAPETVREAPLPQAAQAPQAPQVPYAPPQAAAQTGYAQHQPYPPYGYTPSYQGYEHPVPPYPQQTPPQVPQGYQPPYYQQPAPYAQPPRQENPYREQAQPENPYAYRGPAQPENPYAYHGPTQPRPGVNYTPAPKPATPTGTKVFIIILVALLVMMTVGFIAYIVSHGKGDSDSKKSADPFSIDGGEDNNGFGLFPDSLGGSYKEIEAEITLKADNGETQKRAEDNKDSIGTPDQSVSNIKLEKLPADKDNAKYTTQAAYEDVSASVVTVMCYQDKISDNEKDIVSQGTGTIISADGYIITNAHVIGNGRTYAINIVSNDNKSYQAKVIGFDTWTDLAVLKIDAKNLDAVTFGDSALIEIGEEVIAIGSPGGVKFQNSLTKGIVSAVDRELTINKSVRYIQSDAAISPGNSGGPLCNKYSQVIGITTAKTIATNFENMSFSIPSETVEKIVGDLIHYGYVTGRTRIGFSGMELGNQNAMYYDVPEGVLIEEIDENGSLAGTDIKEDDILTELDGETVTSFQDIYDVLANHKPGDKIKVKVQRAE